jgi:hypothetical protein
MAYYGISDVSGTATIIPTLMAINFESKPAK